ncbi:MgtC/SapB family protein [Candidatus Wolfebacteria bacterium]|nr:MgtC/SapB family protein [Candidatus Wolfebacteria bacterium]
MDFLFQNYEFFLRLVLAVFLGGVIGLEREISHKTAGLRTFSLVSLGSALLTIISVIISNENPPNFNIAAISSQIISGIGFLGAGIIIFHGIHPKGITTAAGIWVAAAVGMATGFGFYGVAVFTAIITISIFTIFWIFEKKVLDKIVDKDEKNI